ncbi:response regulator transcription factor [uncultured Shewanella sp.]|uniref:response regulator transcription factor n=1 Tax=uncultured Shewanella sp. TaxID=173975 RepID=UPI002606E6F4|nr:response regulator transcription factor [uncultured Shewanella sp.]
MLKVKHWMIISRSTLLIDLLKTRWPEEFLITLTSLSPEDKDYRFDDSKLSIVVIDLSSIDVQDAYKLQQKIDRSQRAIRVVFLHFPSQVDTRFLIQKSITAGVFYCDASLDKIGSGLNEIAAGKTVLPFELEQQRKPVKTLSNLSEELTIREREVLKALRLGLTNIDIAEQLFVSESTVKTHLYHSFRKIGVSSRGEAIAWAQANLHEVKQ